MKNRKLFKEAIYTFGYDEQIKMLIEELAELIVAINHNDRGRIELEEVFGEVADVQIMINQFIVMFPEVDYDEIYKEKVLSLKGKIL